MSSLMSTTSEKSMDSREIARLTGKDHRNVRRDIETQLSQIDGGVLRFENTYRHEQNGQVYKFYRLPYRETMILVSGYSVELRAKVIDRWMELERENAKTVSIKRTQPITGSLVNGLLKSYQAGLINKTQFVISLGLEPEVTEASKTAPTTSGTALTPLGRPVDNEIVNIADEIMGIVKPKAWNQVNAVARKAINEAVSRETIRRMNGNLFGDES